MFLASTCIHAHSTGNKQDQNSLRDQLHFRRACNVQRRIGDLALQQLVDLLPQTPNQRADARIRRQTNPIVQHDQALGRPDLHRAPKEKQRVGIAFRRVADERFRRAHEPVVDEPGAAVRPHGEIVGAGMDEDAFFFRAVSDSYVAAATLATAAIAPTANEEFELLCLALLFDAA